MIGHGMCNTNVFAYSLERDESYFDKNSDWTNDEFFRLVELGSPNAYSPVDCDNIKDTAKKWALFPTSFN